MSQQSIFAPVAPPCRTETDSTEMQRKIDERAGTKRKPNRVFNRGWTAARAPLVTKSDSVLF